MRILSWNINGLRSAMSKGFCTWLDRAAGDVVGLQEVRAQEAQLGPCLETLGGGWHGAFSAAQRPGYSGVGLLSRMKPDSVQTSMGDPAFDAEGRVQIARFGRLAVANVYFPNGNGKERDNSRIPYKLAFYQRLFHLIEPEVRRGAPVLVVGDFNTAHREIDLARPKENVKTSGFTPPEREELDRWIRAGWVDTFRSFEPGPGHYSWWSQRFGVRAKNIGWRIDYVLASPGAAKHLRGAFMQPDVAGSDHCPVGVDVDDAIVG